MYSKYWLSFFQNWFNELNVFLFLNNERADHLIIYFIVLHIWIPLIVIIFAMQLVIYVVFVCECKLLLKMDLGAHWKMLFDWQFSLAFLVLNGPNYNSR